MAKKKNRVQLSPGELEIMALLWSEGPRTLAQAHQSFGQYGRPIGYPTMQTRLNRLVSKDLVIRSDDRPAVYRAAVSRDQVGAGRLARLLEKVGRGIVVPMVAHLLAEGELTSEEIAELKRLLAITENAGSHRKQQE